jgi:hypothetical protein
MRFSVRVLPKMCDGEQCDRHGHPKDFAGLNQERVPCADGSKLVLTTRTLPAFSIHWLRLYGSFLPNHFYLVLQTVFFLEVGLAAVGRRLWLLDIYLLID